MGDCEDGTDEHEQCLINGAECDPAGQVYCEDVQSGNVTCLPKTQVCDNITDCQQGEDEQLCQGCPGDYCLNGGKCRLELHWGPVCDCPDSYGGHRCHESVPVTSSALLKGLLPVLALVVIGLIILAYHYRRRWFSKPTSFAKTVHFSGNGVAIENPGFHDDMQMKEYGSTKKSDESDFENNNTQPPNYDFQPPNYNMVMDLQATQETTVDSTAISNPLYRELY